MPRKLPWATKTTTVKFVGATEPPPSKRQRTSSSSQSARRNVSPAPRKSSSATASATVTVTVTAAATSNEDGILAKTEYMLPRDEHYIMVEDEFLTIAQTYTRSVHRAEYKRLQHLAHAKNATRISEIQRPLSGVPRMSKETLLKHELAAKQQAREGALKGLPGVARKWDEDSSGDEARKAARSVWGKSSLGLLMCSPKKRERDLSARWRVKPGTRAAAGFVKAEVDVKKGRLFARPSSQATGGKKIGVEDLTEGSSSSAAKPTVRRVPRPALLEHKPALIKQGTKTDTSSDDDDDDDDLDAPVIWQASSRLPSQSVPITRLSSTAHRSAARPPPAINPTHYLHHRSTTFPPIYPPPTSSTFQSLPKITRHATAPPLHPHSSQPASPPLPLPAPKKPPPDFDFDFGLVSLKRSASSYRGRSMTARKQAERQKLIMSSPPGKAAGGGGGGGGGREVAEVKAFRYVIS